MDSELAALGSGSTGFYTSTQTTPSESGPNKLKLPGRTKSLLVVNKKTGKPLFRIYYSQKPVNNLCTKFCKTHFPMIRGGRAFFFTYPGSTFPALNKSVFLWLNYSA